MEYAVKAETKNGEVVTLKRGFASRRTRRTIRSICICGGAFGWNQ